MLDFESLCFQVLEQDIVNHGFLIGKFEEKYHKLKEEKDKVEQNIKELQGFYKWFFSIFLGFIVMLDQIDRLIFVMLMMPLIAR